MGHGNFDRWQQRALSNASDYQKPVFPPKLVCSGCSGEFSQQMLYRFNHWGNRWFCRPCREKRLKKEAEKYDTHQ